MFKKIEIEEKDWLFCLAKREELAEKKAKIYSRLLTEIALAKEMEALSMRHGKRRESLEKLLYGKPVKKKNERGSVELKGEEQ